MAILTFSRSYDLIFIEKELFPYVPAFIEKLFWPGKTPVVLDFDDAIFHNYDLNQSHIIKKILGQKIPNLMRKANAIVTGGPYLTQYSLCYNKSTFEIPTSVEIEKYPACPVTPDKSNFRIGWIGSSTTSKYAAEIIPALEKFLNDHLDTEVWLIGYSYEERTCNPHHERIIIVPWKEEDEISLLSKIDVGIIPLPDTPWERGKCGYKIVQYMASYKPFIYTPLETNLKIDRNSENLPASTLDEWINALEIVYNNRDHYYKVGINNRNIAETSYSIERNYKSYLDVFNRIINTGV